MLYSGTLFIYFIYNSLYLLMPNSQFSFHIQVISYDICLCLTYLSLYDNLEVHSCWCTVHYFIFYGWVVFHHTHTHTHTHTHIFIYSSVDGHLGCFHVLAIVNNAAKNSGVDVSFWIRVFSRYMLLSIVAVPSGCTNLHSHKGSVFWIEAVIEICCTTVQIYLTLLNCTLKMIKRW